MKSTLPRPTGPSYGPEHDEHFRALEPRSKSDGARPLFGLGTAEDRLGTERARGSSRLREAEKRREPHTLSLLLKKGGRPSEAASHHEPGWRRPQLPGLQIEGAGSSFPAFSWGRTEGGKWRTHQAV